MRPGRGTNASQSSISIHAKVIARVTLMVVRRTYCWAAILASSSAVRTRMNAGSSCQEALPFVKRADIVERSRFSEGLPFLLYLECGV